MKIYRHIKLYFILVAMLYIKTCEKYAFLELNIRYFYIKSTTCFIYIIVNISLVYKLYVTILINYKYISNNNKNLIFCD